MKKLWLIIQREYLTRVKKKTFILTTLLTPLGIAAIMFVSGYLANSSSKLGKNIFLVDEAAMLRQADFTDPLMKFTVHHGESDGLENTFSEAGYDLLVKVPPLVDLTQTKHDILFYSKEKLSFVTLTEIETNVNKAIEAYKISQSGIDKDRLDQLKIRVNMKNANATESGGTIEGDKSNKISIGLSTALSYVMGFMMYMVIFIYGSMVMRSVMEEKINRIVEVMISSVRPFQLMLGKVTGVGLVAMTQLTIWLVLLVLGVVLFGKFMIVDPVSSAEVPQAASEMMNTMKDQADINSIYREVKLLNWGLILPSFVVFFFGGYFIYSSLFAAIGSAMGDDLGEGQQLMMPIIMIVIIAMSMIVPVMNNPNGNLAIFGSMFPFFSPILMPARLPFDPPVWQVILSIVILVLSVVMMTWLAGRIYRVGILMYGKKVSFKEIVKWMFIKG